MLHEVSTSPRPLLCGDFSHHFPTLPFPYLLTWLTSTIIYLPFPDKAGGSFFYHTEVEGNLVVIIQALFLYPSMEPFLPNADIPHSYWTTTPSISSFVFISNRNWNTKCISLSFLLNLSLQPHLIGEKPWHIYLTNCYLSSSSFSFSFYLLVGWEVQNFHFLFSLERTSSLTYIHSC